MITTASGPVCTIQGAETSGATIDHIPGLSLQPKPPHQIFEKLSGSINELVRGIQRRKHPMDFGGPWCFPLSQNGF
jgi:hypothetical protein